MIKDAMEKNEKATPNGADLEVLKKHFGMCFKRGLRTEVPRQELCAAFDFAGDDDGRGAGQRAQCEAGKREEQERLYLRRQPRRAEAPPEVQAGAGEVHLHRSAV